MLSGLLNRASEPICTYFYPPIEDEEDEENYRRRTSVSKHIDWKPLASPDATPTSDDNLPPSCRPLSGSPPEAAHLRVIQAILSAADLYEVLGVRRVVGPIDQQVLRHAYLTRSRKCHPDKFPGITDATKAFQRVSVAYNVLSQPNQKNNYDSMSSEQLKEFDFFRTQPPPEETFRSVLLGALNEFLDGDLEVIRNFLRSTSVFRPPLRLDDEGIESVLMTLHSIRQRALTCRTCVWTVHGELCHLLELQHAFRQLAYTDVWTRSRLTIQVVRITINLPLKIEEALTTDYLQRRGKHSRDCSDEREGHSRTSFIPHRVCLIIRGIVVVLEWMENGLK